ncbi:MAG: lasso peptide isopeptide bond-forming cyclase [Iphinoe sp. HA4291-MV1]|jgi:asparagine synthase (glutamine-hydrolysing)|nr:lasso peptide isopeptide bond-forming cyclase [Iphinoe sp. HA4291-MV1]
MSGIMGVYYLNGRPVDSADLRRMLDILEHRGPDGADIWVDRSIGLGHRMLWTTPESLLEELPLVNKTGDLVITSDARVDNRDELISKLHFDSPQEKITDSQLILAAYEKWGEKCPEYLLGDFAFAIWDGRKQSLFCARDHMGVKPFYYYFQAGKILAFGSEIKALLCLQEVPRLLNKIKVGDYLASICDDKSNTFYQDIFRLPPGSCMALSAKGMQIRSYWSLDPCSELRLSSDEEYAEALREIFAEAVRCRLRSAFPIGSHLSGGLDSSSVTCMARQLITEEGANSRPLYTFSNIFDTISECDERPFIEAVLAQGGMVPHYVHADQQGPLSNLEQIFQYHDDVVPAPTHFLLWGLNHAAYQEGVRVVLDGFDGDNTISHGDGYLTELVRKGMWAEFAKEVGDLYKLGLSPFHYLREHGLLYLEELARGWKWVDFVRETNQLLQHFNISRRQLFLQHGLKPLFPQSLLSAWRVLRRRKQLPKSRQSIIKRSFAKQIALNKRIQAFTDFPSRQLLTERERHWRGLTSGVLTLGLEVSDHYATAFSLELRHPFMDKRLIEFCLSLPPEQKLNQGWSRLVMRRAMTKILPEQVQWRRGKSDMSLSFVHGLLVHNRELVDEVMQNHLTDIAEYVNTNNLRKIYEELISGKHIKPPESLIDVSLWQVAMFALWLRHTYSRIKASEVRICPPGTLREQK